jgi:hypothetical protein
VTAAFLARKIILPSRPQPCQGLFGARRNSFAFVCRPWPLDSAPSLGGARRASSVCRRPVAVRHLPGVHFAT